MADLVAVRNRHPGGASATPLTTSWADVLTLYSPRSSPASNGKLCLERWSQAAVAVNVDKSTSATASAGTYAVEIRLVLDDGTNDHISRTYRFDLSSVAAVVNGHIVTASGGNTLREFITRSSADSEVRLSDTSDEDAFIGSVQMSFSEINPNSDKTPVGDIKLPLVLLSGETLKVQMRIGTTSQFSASVRAVSLGEATEEQV